MMARIEPLTPKMWPAEMRDAFAALMPTERRYRIEPRDDRPKGTNAMGTFAHHPALAKAFFAFNAHVISNTTLTQRQRELLAMRVAAVRGSTYQWLQHTYIASDAGIDGDEVARIARDPGPGEWTEFEAALLRSVDELIAGGTISTRTWSELENELDSRQLLDVIFTVGAYDTSAWMFRAVGVDLDDDLVAMSGADGIPPVGQR